MRCPIHEEQLIKVGKGFSYCCPRCEYKIHDPAKYWLPEMRRSVEIPSAFAWSLWTLTDLTTDVSGNLVLDSGKITGTAISPQMINLTRNSTRYWDCTKVKLTWTHNNERTNDIKYFASNDGGATYRIIKTSNATFELNKGNELRQYKQVKYNDLRIKITLERNAITDTSPCVSKIVIMYNKIKL